MATVYPVNPQPYLPVNVEVFSHQGIWYNRFAIFKILIIIPIIIAVGTFLYRIYNDPKAFHQLAQKFKKSFLHTFCQREDELPSTHYKRVAFQVVKILTLLTLLTGAAFTAFYLLPPLFAISMLICLIVFSVKGYQNRHKIPELIAWLKTAFIRQKEETSSAATKRILKNIAKVTACVAIIALLIFIPIHIHGIILSNPKINQSIYNLVELLPFQTPPVVIAEYFAFASLHFYKAYNCYKKDEKGKAAFHLIAAFISCIFPLLNHFCFPRDTYGNPNFRLHHVAIGILFMLFPAAPLQFLGSAIALDSCLYSFSEQRFKNYDLMNLIVANIGIIFLIYTLTCSFSLLVNSWLADRAKAKKIAQRQQLQKEIDQQLLAIEKAEALKAS